jgi:DNA-binding transcriptional ArsR family regulator
VPGWSFLTNHARVLICIANDPSVRLRDIAAATGMTERTAYGVVVDLTEAGYIIKEKDGRRNRYRVQPDHAVHEPTARGQTLGELLDQLVGPADATPPVTDEGDDADRRQHDDDRGGHPRLS